MLDFLVLFYLLIPKNGPYHLAHMGSCPLGLGGDGSVLPGFVYACLYPV